MAIVCGTDFSEQAMTAGLAAAALARKLGQTLVLLHVSKLRDEDEKLPPARANELVQKRGKTAQELTAQAETMRKFGVEVEEVLEAGDADETVARYAEKTGASAIVVGTHGRRGPRAWVLGSVAQRTAQTASCPVLVFRGSAARWQAWAAGQGTLKLFVGVDFSPVTERALAWACTLVAAGGVELKCAHVLWPPAEAKRQGTTGSDTDLPRGPQELRPQLEHDLAERIKTLLPKGTGPCEIKNSWGRPADLIADWAKEEAADLIVVGTRQITGMAKVWEGSVAQGVITSTSMPIACIPPA